jgi:Tfp pilus assembly protein PilN
VAVHTRAFPETPGEENRRQFASELAAKAKLANAPVKSVAGTPSARREGDKLIFELKDSAGTVIAATAVARADQDTLDVRDRALLYKRQRDRNRGEFVWRLLLTGGAAAAVSLLLDLGALSFRLLDRAQQSRVAAQAPLVQKLQTAQALTSRIDELTHRRLRFFEMLSTVNDARPKSIQFTRTGTSGRNALEIEAQTSSADDVGAFESALNKLATLEKVEVKDLRAREGVTTFGITIAFKADAKPDASPATSGGAP